MKTNNYKIQSLGLSEWLNNFDSKKSRKFILEEKSKEKRLQKLRELIGLPSVPTFVFNYDELSEKKFKLFYKYNKNKTFNLRLLPTEKSLPVIRNKNKTLIEQIRWLNKLMVDKCKYKLLFKTFVRTTEWSTLFIVNKKGISGEIIKGISPQLTTGWQKYNSVKFHYDFKKWHFSSSSKEFIKKIKVLVKYLFVKSQKIQKVIKNEIGASFASGYLEGYFECVFPNTKYGAWFIDYNRLVSKLYENSIFVELDRNIGNQGKLLEGVCGSPGRVKGIVKIVKEKDIHSALRSHFDILITKITTPKFIPLVKKVKAIITDEGGVLSHASIVCRELNIPCLIGTKIATKVFKDGDMVEVDAEKGIVRKI